MASEAYYGQCKCCLKETYLKNMWFTGQKEDEIFGQMLVDCFSIDWMIQGDLEEDKICEECISKLKIAVEFKRQVLQSQTESLHSDKAFYVEQNVKETNSNEVKKLKEEEDNEEEEASENEEKNDDVEYLEEEVLVEKGSNNDDDDSQDYEPVEKQPKLKIKRTRLRREYTEEDLQKAVEAFKSKEMTRAKAAETFKVPPKAISRRLYGLENAKKEKRDIYNSKEMAKAMKAIITHTNATPFRIKNNKFYCFFCPPIAPGFEDPDKLREHTFSAHDDVVTDVEYAIRPPHLNQMIRVDILDLKCGCGEEITWPILSEHLEKRHNVTGIKDSWKKIVPFLLIDEPRKEIPCALCDVSACLTQMDTHINKHYSNFICRQCGKPFVTIYRLKSHELFHDNGHYACEICGQVFSNLKCKRAHFSVQHCSKLYHKCTLCPEKFTTDQLRYRHLKKDHADLLESKGKRCRICDQSFWPREYWRHMKIAHPQYHCDKCDKKFGSESILSSHTCVVETVKYQCDLCYEMFDTVEEVVQHKETCQDDGTVESE